MYMALITIKFLGMSGKNTYKDELSHIATATGRIEAFMNNFYA